MTLSRSLPTLPSFTHVALLLAVTLVPNRVANAQSESEPFPYVIKDLAKDSIAAFADLNPQPAGDDGFCRVVDGHFANNAGRLKIWGMNLCFGANFPDHGEATRLASRLAAFGINGVRIHHQETSLSPNGLYSNDGEMDPVQVDKLDYLLAELHKNGIYANINLHVGRSVRQSLGLPELGQGHSATGDKHAMHFMPQLQESFWQYCRDYLGHVNPYRKLARANDPVGSIELVDRT